MSKTVLVCAAAGNRELILLFSYYITFISEKESIMHSQHPLDLCSVVFTLYMHSVTDMTNLLELVTGQRYLMMSCREF